VERVSAALGQLGCLRGVKRETETKDKKKTVEVSRSCAYDKFLRQPEKKQDLATSLMTEAYAAPCLPGAECFKWHGSWVYCRGRCEKVDFSDVWTGDLRDDPGLDRADHSDSDCRALPARHATLAELDEVLRRLGMLAEVGQAAKTWGHRAPPPRALPSVAETSSGRTLEQYRRASLAPGARLIEWEPAPSKKTAASRRASSRAAARSQSCEASRPPRRRAPAAPPKPPRLGCFRCTFCGSVFGLHRTLKLHVRSVHPGLRCPGPGEAVPSAAPDVAPTISRVHGTGGSVPGLAPSTSSMGYAPVQTATIKAKPAPAAVRPAPKAAKARPPAEEIPEDVTAERQESESPCPICFVSFPRASIEAHVESCLAAAEVAPLTSDSESESDVGGFVGVKKTDGGNSVSYSTWAVLEAFKASGPTELSVRHGDRVVVVWQQPPEEGGYWAYGFNQKLKSRAGYVPLQHLALLEEGSRQRESALVAPVKPEPAPECTPEATSAGEATEGTAREWCLPDAWLESFLLLDLSEEKSDEFWVNFEHLQEEMSRDQAWLRAIDRACSEDGVGRASRGGQQRGRQLTPVEAKPASVKEEAAGPREEGSDVCEVSADFEPTDEQAGIQLQVVAGQRLVVEWRQPAAEGGFWAYGSLEGKPGKKGYVPMQLLGPPARGTQQAAEPPAPPQGTKQPEVSGESRWRRRHAAAARDAGGATTAKELEEWAQAKLETLASRFCLEGLDAACAFSALSVCSTAAEMRQEAVSLFADNAPVKNFADELWRRRCLVA